MATVYKRIKGRKVVKFLAKRPEVQQALEQDAQGYARRARRNLAEHRQEGHAFIAVEKGKIDRYVVLNDERGLSGAMSMEFGRAPGYDDEGNEYPGMDPLWILHDAFALPTRLGPKRRRKRKSKSEG